MFIALLIHNFLSTISEFLLTDFIVWKLWDKELIMDHCSKVSLFNIFLKKYTFTQPMVSINISLGVIEAFTIH